MISKPENNMGMLNKSKIETAIENNPVQAAQQLPQGSPIQKEAIQAIDGGADAEVNNKVLDNFVRHDWEDVTEIPEWNTEQKRYNDDKRKEWLNDYNKAGREVFEALNNPNYAIYEDELPITLDGGEKDYSGTSRAWDLDRLLWREPDYNKEDLSKLGSAYRNVSNSRSTYMENMIANAYREYLKRNKDVAEDYYSDERLKKPIAKTGRRINE